DDPGPLECRGSGVDSRSLDCALVELGLVVRVLEGDDLASQRLDLLNPLVAELLGRLDALAELPARLGTGRVGCAEGLRRDREQEPEQNRRDQEQPRPAPCAAGQAGLLAGVSP